MKKIVFYSWQSDLPNPTNRGFIQTALENAVKKITQDDAVAVEPVVDRDTQGVAGAPDIASTIFAKIVSADIFVADVSIINKSKKYRPTPNPNVLIELGYALQNFGHERIVLIFNNHFGDIKDLPFDLRTRRVATYSMKNEETDRSKERKKLESNLETAIRAALKLIPQEEQVVAIPAVEAIESEFRNKIIILRKNLSEIFNKLNILKPKIISEGGTVDELLESINNTQEAVAEFSKIVETAVIIGDKESILEIYKWFGKIFEKYELPKGYSGKYSTADFDYFKFIGHELFVTLIAFLVREQKWDLLKFILNKFIPVGYLQEDGGSGYVDWSYASNHISSLHDESKKKRRMSIHADVLNTRHDQGGLSSLLSIEEFVDADFFLWLFGEITPEKNNDGFFDWRPWSYIYLKHVPMFIKAARQINVAKNIANVFNINDVNVFKKRLSERIPKLSKFLSSGTWMSPFRGNEIDEIGTK